MSALKPFLSRGLQQTIDETEIKDGKILFAIDSARLFMDTKNGRIEITDVVKGLKYSEILALKSPLPKLYLSSDSHQLLLYDFKEEEWIVYSGGIAPEKAVVDLRFEENGDIVLTNNTTWDGEHTSLKQTIAALVSAGGGGTTVEHLTQAQYDDLTPEQKSDTTKLYWVD